MHKKAPKVQMITGIGGTSLTFGAFKGLSLEVKIYIFPILPPTKVLISLCAMKNKNYLCNVLMKIQDRWSF